MFVAFCNCTCRFRQGLDVGHVLTCIRRNSTAWKAVFVHPDCPLLTARQLIEMFTPQLSPEGNYKRIAETKVLAYWGDWLVEVAGMDLSVVPNSLNM